MEVPLKGSRLHHQFSCSFQHWIVSNGVYGLVTTKTTSPLTPPWGFQHYKINWTECLLVLPFIGQKGKKKVFCCCCVMCYVWVQIFEPEKKRAAICSKKSLIMTTTTMQCVDFYISEFVWCFFPWKWNFFYRLKFPQLQKKMNSILGIMCMKIEKDSLVVHLSK